MRHQVPRPGGVTPISPSCINLHWLPISTRIEYKILLIVLKAQMGVAPKYLHDAIRLPTSASSLHPLPSLDRRELFVPQTRTTMAMSRSLSLFLELIEPKAPLFAHG